MSFVSVSCLGSMAVAKKLTRAAMATETVGVPDGLSSAALVVERRAKQIVREKNIIDTGNLFNEIMTVPPTSPNVREVISGAEYSIYNEMGTSKMPARPYMRPALDESQAQIEQVLGVSVTKTISAALGG